MTRSANPIVLLAALFSAYIVVWALAHPGAIPAATEHTTLAQKVYAARHLAPVVALIAVVLGSIYAGIATATEAAAFGVLGAFAISVLQRSMSWRTFVESLLGATRLYCMIALILAGAAFLTLTMGYLGLPRHLAEWIAEDIAPIASPQTLENLAILRSRAARMQALLTGLLAYARVGRDNLLAETVDTAAAVRELVATLALPDGFTVSVSRSMVMRRSMFPMLSIRPSTE